MGVIAFGAIILTHPQIASAGIKKGLLLLYDSLIPALFPFMIVSCYIARSPVTDRISIMANKLTYRCLHINAYHTLAFTLGCLGGYPVGAKTITEFRRQGFITLTDSHRLFCCCVNPGASFVITAVGSFMLGSTISGIIIYASCIASSLVLGAFSSLLFKSSEEASPRKETDTRHDNVFIKSVSSGVESMLGICGWVILCSALCELSAQLISNDGARLFINAVAEVSSGCKSTIEAGLSLPVLCAVISFGGLAVAAQISPDLADSGIKLKTYICWRVAGSAISALFCSGLTKIFPQSIAVSTTLTPVHTLTRGIPTALVMVFMCIVLIFEVDNKRKVW